MGAITPIVSGLSALNGIAGGVIPALGAVTQIVSAVQTLGGNGRAGGQQDIALQQLQQRQKLQQRQLTAKTALDREKLNVQAKQNEEERRSALRRAVARQRARFGGSGVGSNGGSSEAVLLGLFDETEEDLSRRDALDNLRNRALDLDVSQNRSLNVLQATQLAERNNLTRLF